MKKTFLPALLKWHRRSGLIIAPIVVLLVVTGIFINHSDFFGWAHKPVYSPLIAKLYGINNPKITQGFNQTLNQQNIWLTQVDNHIFLSQQEIADCNGTLKGAVIRQQDMALLCDHTLVWLTTSGELIETLTNLPASAQNLGLAKNNAIALLATQKIELFNEDSGEWNDENIAAENISWSQSQTLPTKLAEALNQQRPIPGITQERFLLDLHSGRLFGKVGVLVMDIATLLLLLLAATGACSLWLRNKKTNKQKR
ncbi:MAG: PepSY domain-containing protein [Marinagarivorans sp.]|nr:PepSY domain-containing protein [Marinagarivorans sp.]